MSEVEDKALRDLDRASVNVRKGLTVAGKGAKYEKEYADAYAKCVNLGLKPKVRTRYRFS